MRCGTPPLQAAHRISSPVPVVRSVWLGIGKVRGSYTFLCLAKRSDLDRQTGRFDSIDSIDKGQMFALKPIQTDSNPKFFQLRQAVQPCRTPSPVRRLDLRVRNRMESVSNIRDRKRIGSGSCCWLGRDGMR